MTDEGCGPRAALAGNVSSNQAHAPERTHLQQRAWPRGDDRPRDDCRPRTGRPGGLVWRGPVNPLRLSHCDSNHQLGRVPGTVPPNRARAGLHLQTGGWMKQRLGPPSSHCELSLRLQQQKEVLGQALGSCEQPPNRSGSLASRSDLITLGRAILASERFWEISPSPCSGLTA